MSTTTDTSIDAVEAIRAIDGCGAAREFAAGMSARQAWKRCDNPDWMLFAWESLRDVKGMPGVREARLATAAVMRLHSPSEPAVAKVWGGAIAALETGKADARRAARIAAARATALAPNGLLYTLNDVAYPEAYTLYYAEQLLQRRARYSLNALEQAISLTSYNWRGDEGIEASDDAICDAIRSVVTPNWEALRAIVTRRGRRRS